MTRLRPVLLALLLITTTLTAQVQPTHDEHTLAAQKADLAWLTLVDSGQYEQSWKEAGVAFQSAVTQEKWKNAMKQARDPLGKVVLRKMESAAYSTSLPGAPDGQYEVIIFNTSFEHKRAGYETVITSVQKDGTWRIVGYYIK
jgi:uncharacterized protein DUF4019